MEKDHICIVRTKGLTKRFAKTNAVDNIDISLRKGEICGFLGRNGAGKTTTMRMLLGLVRPTSGSIELFSNPVRPGQYKHLGRIGSIIENPGFYSNLSGPENLEIHRRMVGETDRQSVDRAMETVDLAGAGKKLVRKYSMGMKQRLGIARAILHNPELLILDEPNQNLDPQGIQHMRGLYKKLATEYGVTIFISSHILSEIEQISDRICILDKGSIIEEVDTESIRRKNRSYIQLRVDDEKKTVRILESELGISEIRIADDRSIQVFERYDQSADLVKTLIMNGISVSENTVVKESLEHYFLSLTGNRYDA